MKTADFIREHHACRKGAKWALSISGDMSVVWEALIDRGKHKWLMWTATQLGVFSDSTLRRLACRFVRETPLMDGRVVWDLLTDERSRRAVEVADRYAEAQATIDELDAACAAAYAAADAAYSAADRAAADAAYSTARAAYAAYVAAEAIYSNAYAARVAAYSAAEATYSDADAARAARAAAKSAQVRMIAELGNPFKKGIQQ